MDINGVLRISRFIVFLLTRRVTFLFFALARCGSETRKNWGVYIPHRLCRLVQVLRNNVCLQVKASCQCFWDTSRTKLRVYIGPTDRCVYSHWPGRHVTVTTPAKNIVYLLLASLGVISTTSRLLGEGRQHYF